MEEIGRGSILYDNSPPMNSPLVQKLGYNGMKTWGYNIILGKEIGEDS